MALPFLHRRCEQEKFVRILITLCHDGKEKELIFFSFYFFVRLYRIYLISAVFAKKKGKEKKLTTACGSN